MRLVPLMSLLPFCSQALHLVRIATVHELAVKKMPQRLQNKKLTRDVAKKLEDN